MQKLVIDDYAGKCVPISITRTVAFSVNLQKVGMKFTTFTKICK